MGGVDFLVQFHCFGGGLHAVMAEGIFQADALGLVEIQNGVILVDE